MLKRRFNNQHYRASALREETIKDGISMKKKGNDYWHAVKCEYGKKARKVRMDRVNEALFKKNPWPTISEHNFMINPDVDPFNDMMPDMPEEHNPMVVLVDEELNDIEQAQDNDSESEQDNEDDGPLFHFIGE